MLWINILTLCTFTVSGGDSLPNEYKKAMVELLKKTKLPVPAKGHDFPPIPGPKIKSKIGVIGGGASGVHMAYSLKQMGFEDVTILEKSNR